ncbi:hypothetical protein BDV97DRAFT_183554 [Delphinella strobiligena]|nr:hypothetical protein BDV97DRAFT_183554 [Delphinella strobiligena]
MDDTQTSLSVSAPHVPAATMPRDIATVAAGSRDQSGAFAASLPPNRIMSLPAEVRIMVYKAVFAIDRRFPPVFGSAVSKEIRNEALPVFVEDLGLKISVGFRLIPGKEPPPLQGRCAWRNGPTPDTHKPRSLRASFYSRGTPYDIDANPQDKHKHTTVIEIMSKGRWKMLSENVNGFLNQWAGGSKGLFDYLREVWFVVLDESGGCLCEVRLCFPSDGQDPTIEVDEEPDDVHAYIRMLRVMLEMELSQWIDRSRFALRKINRREQLRFSKGLYDALIRHIHHYQMSLWYNWIEEG